MVVFVVVFSVDFASVVVVFVAVVLALLVVSVPMFALVLVSTMEPKLN